MVRIFLIIICVAAFASCENSSGRSENFLNYDPTHYQRVSLNYEISGESDTCLVFIHGWNLNMRYWDAQVQMLRNRYRILNLDLAGHGNSGKDRETWSVESFAKDIIGLLEKESLQNVILIAHSMGGDIALQVRELAPNRIIGIIGVDNFKDVAFRMTDDQFDSFTEYLNRFKRNYEEMSDEFAREHIRSRDRLVINRIVKDYKSADPKIALEVFKFLIPKHEEEKDLLRQLPFKLHLILSDYIPADEKSLRQYAGGGYDITWIQGSGHFPMVEQPEQFNAALTAVLAKVTAQRY